MKNASNSIGSMNNETELSAPVEVSSELPMMGFAASAGTAEGIAIVLDENGDLSALSGIKKDSILVCKTMSRSLLVVIPKLKGIVAEVGGVFAVASGAARWFKVPAVVGVDGITKKIKDGDFIRINGDTGTVEIIPETALASAV